MRQEWQRLVQLWSFNRILCPCHSIAPDRTSTQLAKHSRLIPTTALIQLRLRVARTMFQRLSARHAVKKRNTSRLRQDLHQVDHHFRVSSSSNRRNNHLRFLTISGMLLPFPTSSLLLHKGHLYQPGRQPRHPRMLIPRARTTEWQRIRSSTMRMVPDHHRSPAYHSLIGTNIKRHDLLRDIPTISIRKKYPPSSIDLDPTMQTTSLLRVTFIDRSHQQITLPCMAEVHLLLLLRSMATRHCQLAVAMEAIL